MLPLPGFRGIVKLLAFYVTGPLTSVGVGIGILVLVSNILKLVALPIVAWLDKVSISQVWHHYFVELTTNGQNTMPSAGIVLIGIYLVSAGVGFGIGKYFYDYFDNLTYPDF